VLCLIKYERYGVHVARDFLGNIRKARELQC
jgi:hypothetical protein